MPQGPLIGGNYFHNRNQSMDVGINVGKIKNKL